MTLRAENELVLADVEAVYGVAEALTGADAIQCDFEITPMEATPKTRAFSRPYYGARPTILTEVHRAIKMTNIELAGSGAATTPPAWARILRGCGWSVTVGASDVKFNPVTNAVDSLTIEPSIDGELFRLIGARGTASFMWEIGEIPTIEANFKGGWVDPSTLVTVPTPNYSGWMIPRSVNCENTAAIDIDGEDYPFYSLKIDQGATVEFYCVPGEPGYRIEHTAREVKGTVKLQAKAIDDHDLFAMVKSAALFPIAMEHGTVVGGIVGMTAPAVQLLNPRKSDYKGDLAWELDLMFVPTAAGDDEVVIYSK